MERKKTRKKSPKPSISRVKKEIEQIAKEVGGEVIVTRPGKINFQDLMAFQYGSQEESDEAFAKMKKAKK